MLPESAFPAFEPALRVLDSLRAIAVLAILVHQIAYCVGARRLVRPSGVLEARQRLSVNPPRGNGARASHQDP